MAQRLSMKCSRKKTELGYSVLSESEDDNDCGVRALEVALDITYQEAFEFLASQGRVPGDGMPMRWLYSYERYKEPLFGFLIKPHRFGRRLRVKRRQQAFSEGCWLVLVTGHIFAIKDGVVYDTLDLDELMESLVVYAWRITPYLVAAL